MSKAFLPVLLSLFVLASCGGGEPGQTTALTAASTTVKPSTVPQWKLVDIGALTGTDYSGATGINALGDVVGSGYRDASGASQGFLYRNGKMTGIPILPVGINKFGTIIGTDTANTLNALVFENGVIRNLGNLGGRFGDGSGPMAINDKGQIVGYSWGYDSAAAFTWIRAFLYSDGRMQDLGTIDDAPISSALAINKKGQIVGYTRNPTTGVQKGFLYQNGQMIDLSPYGVLVAWGINDDGVIVGYSTTGGGVIYDSAKGTSSFVSGITMYSINNNGLIAGSLSALGAGLYQNGQIIDLNSTSVVNRPTDLYRISAPSAINDRGEIVGSAYYGNEFGTKYRAYLLEQVR